MNDVITELGKGIEQGQTISESINELIRKEIETAVNQLLENELTVFLDYEKWDPIGYNSGNSRNGSYTRELHTKYGMIQIQIPRDRNGEFKQHTVPRYKRNDGSLEDMVIQLYRKGITTSEIAELIEKMYGNYYTPQTISNLTKSTQELVEQFHTRELSKRYTVIYGDATYVNVRRDTVRKEALHILIGISDKGNKEIIDYQLYPSESSENYREMMKDIKSRGVEEVLLFVSDGLKELRNVFLEEYPKAKHQACWVHVIRSIGRNIRRTDYSEVFEDLKKVYQSPNEAAAIKELERFIGKYKQRYLKAVKSLQENPSLFAFYSFPKAIQRSIYTSNMIESFNKFFKKDIKKKEQFPNENALDRFTCVKAIDFNTKGSARYIRGFKECEYEINELFEQVYGN